LLHLQNVYEVKEMAPPQSAPQHFTLSTASVEKKARREWLQEVIGKEYTRVRVTPPTDAELFNEMTFYAWDTLRVSMVRSHAITIDRFKHDPYHHHQDNYLGVLLLSGQYKLEQNHREVFLEPGDMTIYDATKPHRIVCPKNFSKLILTIPRSVMRDRLAGVEHCTALRIPGDRGVGVIARDFIRGAISNSAAMTNQQFCALSGQALDLFTLALGNVMPAHASLSRSRSLSLQKARDFIQRNLANPLLDTEMIAMGTQLSARYLNELFNEVDTSLMRYVWQQRLEQCRKDILNTRPTSASISQVAMRWGFNDLSHFSRSFKKKFGQSPRELRHEDFTARI
jgi:AraC family transcriptional activator of tynA and feaB